MPSADYTFRLNRLRCNSKRSNDDYVDKDFVIFGVVVNGTVFSAPNSTPPNWDGSIGLVTNGNDIRLYDPDIGRSVDLGWQIGPITVDDQDQVGVFYTITNLSYVDPGQQSAEALKIEAGVLGTVAGVVAAVGGPVGAAAGVIIAAIAGVFAIIGEFVGWLGGGGQKNCDGLVATSAPFSFSGAQLEMQVSTPIPNQQDVTQFTTTFVNSQLTQPTGNGCWTPNTDVTWTIMRDIRSQHQFGNAPPPRMSTMMMLAASQSPQDWAGTWGDGQFYEDSRIHCTINPSGNGVSGLSVGDRVNSYLAGLRHSIATERHTLTLLGARAHAVRPSSFSIISLPTASAAGNGVSVAPVSARYSAIVSERIGSANGRLVKQFTSEHLVEVPMMAEPFTTDLYPSDNPAVSGRVANNLEPVAALAATHAIEETSPHQVRSGIATNVGLQRPAAKISPGVTGAIQLDPGIANNVSVSTAHDLSLPFAATLVASTDISLELFGRVDQRGTLTDHRVRYVRTDPDGDIVTDVMLAPVAKRPS